VYGYNANGWLTSRRFYSSASSYRQTLYTYDPNGNRTYRTSSSGWLQYSWDDENRLITVETDTSQTLESYRFKTEFLYDGRQRLRVRKEWAWQYGGWYGPMSETRHLYDGMLVIQERTGSHVPQISYTRGLDLSGTLAGAGAIGGLLARSRHATSSPSGITGTSFYHADANGNVTYLANSSGGADAAYKYDPFGRWLAHTGPYASANAMRFSSKPWVAHNGSNSDGLYYYGYRFYDPLTQRWPNRDPIEDIGGTNLYGFVGNNPISRVDILGLIPPMDVPWWPPQPPPTPRPKPPQYPEGFAICQRDVAVDGPSDSVGKCCNGFGGQHTFLQYVNTPQPPEQGPPFIWGWGFSGGTHTAAEGHFAPDSCKPCTKNGNALKFGSGAGKASNSATDEEIRDCIMNRKPTRPYSFPRYVCTDWAKEAAADCGLTCK
jgi:RHS repeat-associated protein